MSIRPVKSIVQSQPTIEGAGVRLRRAFGFGDTAETDPFLLLDDFRNDRPADYLAGFPWLNTSRCLVRCRDYCIDYTSSKVNIY